MQSLAVYIFYTMCVCTRVCPQDLIFRGWPKVPCRGSLFSFYITTFVTRQQIWKDIITGRRGSVVLTRLLASKNWLCHFHKVVEGDSYEKWADFLGKLKHVDSQEESWQALFWCIDSLLRNWGWKQFCSETGIKTKMVNVFVSVLLKISLNRLSN